jgi:FlaA1/EpsC-like NDP-sugar epimerase
MMDFFDRTQADAPSTTLDGKRILVTGGTGSLGKVLVRRLLGYSAGRPAQIIVFSRDEAKQHDLRVEYQRQHYATDEVIYENFRRILTFRIGDVRDYASVSAALADVDLVINAAALKQVPTCEYFPYEAVQTNIIGAENIVRAIRDLKLQVETVVGISTDKAVKPVNVMGMTKSIQERIFSRGNLEVSRTRFVICRYGNVLASRGSVIPLFHEQIRNGGPVTVTDLEMTRFLISLEEAVDLILAAIQNASPGETYIPRVPSARIVDVAAALIGERAIKTKITGSRPGEKLHEVLISEEEAPRTIQQEPYYVIEPILPELRSDLPAKRVLNSEYSSANDVLSPQGVIDLLRRRRLMLEDRLQLDGEFLT